MLAFVAFNLPLCLTKSVHKLTTNAENSDDLSYFLREQVARYFYYAKMAVNLPLLLVDAAFRRSVRMSVIVIMRTLGRFQQLRMRDEDTWEADDDDDDTTAAIPPTTATTPAAGGDAAVQRLEEEDEMMTSSAYRDRVHHHYQGNGCSIDHHAECGQRIVLVEDAV